MCKECDQKDKRIKELEAMIRRFAESFDDYEAKIEYKRTIERAVKEGPRRLTAKN